MTTLDLTQIPDNWNVPGSNAEITAVRSGETLVTMPLRVLIIGQLSGGTATALTAVPVTDPSQPPALFGVGTSLARAAVMFLTAAPYVQVDVIGVKADASFVQAAGSILPAGQATANGTVALIVGGVRVPVVVTQGMTAAQVQAAMIAAIATVPAAAALVKAASGSGASVALTVQEAGIIGNDLDLRMSAAHADQVPGIGFTVTPFAGGTGSVDIADALDAVSNTWYTDIALTVNDANSLTTFAAELVRRYGAMVRQDAHGFVGFRGTYSDTLALLQTLNCPYLSVVAAKSPRWAPWEAAAALCGIAAQASNNDPARQMQDLVLTGLQGLAPDAADLYDETMRNVILGQGGSTFKVAQDGTVSIERVPTTYKTDANGLPSTAYQDIMTPKTDTRVRYEWRSYTSGWSRMKLADDGSPLSMLEGVITPAIAKTEALIQLKLYEAQGWITDVDDLSDQVLFWIDPNNKNRLLYKMPIKVIGNLIRLDGQIQTEY
ncbi:phage tail protein [Acetobacter persici]|uniref:phage tail sheath subtilisin-like domain-containing protein n=1 Tax=Acetobacter persici TaxID=1076596 RepID=UPI0020CD9694|nr:phage tail sheath subtilisin-like domain-containing protein [Acetobacter persici]MCP9320105.1 phage tail protein [Acetobacter persici]